MTDAVQPSSNGPQRAPSKLLLILLPTIAAIGLLLFVLRAISVRGVFDNAALMQDVWFQVTLLDAYLGFLIFYAWVAWKEPSTTARIVWFVLLMSLGNIAACGYLVLQFLRLPSNHSPSEILNR